MFSRALLKERARTAIRENYWRCVLVGLVLLLFCYNTISSRTNESVNTAPTSSETISMDTFLNTEAILNGTAETDPIEEIGTVLTTTKNGIYNIALKVGEQSITFGAMLGVVTLALSIFVFNMLEVGGARFFLENADSAEADSASLLFPFKNRNYSSMVAIMVMKDIKIFLWSMLFIIPGIMKAYEYMLVPYILAENPDMEYKEVFAESRRLMTGSKFDAFVLDLSFIGWGFLNTLTFQLSGIFFSNPYQYATRVEMYRWLQVMKDGSEEVIFDAKYTDVAEYLEEDEENAE